MIEIAGGILLAVAVLFFLLLGIEEWDDWRSFRPVRRRK
jgi:hypothetical protein